MSEASPAPSRETNKTQFGPRTDAMEQPQVDATMASLPRVRRRGPLYAMTFRNFRLFFVGQLISVAGTWMQQVAQNWMVWELTHDPRWLGFVAAASAIPYVLFSILGGQIADRYPKRTILIWMQTVQMVLAFILALLATGWWIPLQAWHIVLLSGLLGLSSAFNMPAQQAFVVELVDDRDALANAIALSSLRFNLARFIGPILAGAALQRLSAASCFALNGLSFVAVIISLVMMRVPPSKVVSRGLNVFEGFRYIARNRRVLRVVLLIGCGSLFTWSSSTLFPMLATLFGRNESGYTQLMVVNGIGAAIGASLLAVAGERIPRRLQVYGGAALFCVTLIALSCIPVPSAYIALLALLFVSGFAMIVFAMSAQTLVQQEVPDELRGRVLAVYSLVFQGLFPIGGVEIGFLANHFHAMPAIRFNAVIALAVTLAVYAWNLSERRRRLAVA